MAGSIYRLPVWDTISEAWHKTYGAKATIWAAFLLNFLFVLIMGVINNFFTDKQPAIAPIISLFTQILTLFLQMGLIYIAIQRAFDLPIKYTMLFYAFQAEIAWRLIVMYILKFLWLLPIIAIGCFAVITMLVAKQSELIATIFFIIAVLSLFAFIYVVVRMSLASSFILDKMTNPWPAIKASFEATRHNFWNLIGIYLLQLLIIFISMIPLFIGLIWTLPFAFILFGFIYKKLLLNLNPAK